MQQDELPRYHLNSLFTTTDSNAKPFGGYTEATGLSVTEHRLTIDKTLHYYVTCITGTLTHMAGQNNIRGFFQIIYMNQYCHTSAFRLPGYLQAFRSDGFHRPRPLFWSSCLTPPIHSLCFEIVLF